jgi:hypothetical protein
MGKTEPKTEFPRKYTSQCCGKASHETQHNAVLAAHKLARKEPSKIFRPYHCPYCRAWHVGAVDRLFPVKKENKLHNIKKSVVNDTRIEFV